MKKRDFEDYSTSNADVDSGDKKRRNVDNKGNTPLHLAATEGKVEEIKRLLEQGADIHAKNNEGKTPLHLALMREESDAAIYLLDQGADPNIQNNNGHTALHYALYKMKEKLTYVHAGGAYQAKHFCKQKKATDADNKKIRALLEKGADVNILDNEGQTALHISTKITMLETEVIDELFNGIKDVNIKDIRSNTPLNSLMGFLSGWQRHEKNCPIESSYKVKINYVMQKLLEHKSIDLNYEKSFNFHKKYTKGINDQNLQLFLYKGARIFCKNKNNIDERIPNMLTENASEKLKLLFGSSVSSKIALCVLQLETTLKEIADYITYDKVQLRYGGSKETIMERCGVER